MKKIITMMILVLIVFVVGCAENKSTNGGNSLSIEELDELPVEERTPEEVEFYQENQALAGQAGARPPRTITAYTCADTDDPTLVANGLVYDVKGTVTGTIIFSDGTVKNVRPAEDICSGRLLENFCNPTDLGPSPRRVSYICPQGACVDGACMICTDSDGDDKYAAGTVTNAKDNRGQAVPLKTDQCGSGIYLEYTCGTDGKYKTSKGRCSCADATRCQRPAEAPVPGLPSRREGEGSSVERPLPNHD